VAADASWSTSNQPMTNATLSVDVQVPASRQERMRSLTSAIACARASADRRCDHACIVPVSIGRRSRAAFEAGAFAQLGDLYAEDALLDWSAVVGERFRGSRSGAALPAATRAL
jgi:hypothetical protein